MLGMGTRPATPLPEPHQSLCCFHENPEKPRVRAGHRALAEGSRRLHPPSARTRPAPAGRAACGCRDPFVSAILWRSPNTKLSPAALCPATAPFTCNHAKTF